ncbi:MAG TPA: mandelate racemase/muconate lactonizing enzyme family protein [Chloroflexota bacterium]|nr:mandelate racemase/muconate lactonizing enzyme family protein [Chloroflexota bacterium]
MKITRVTLLHGPDEGRGQKRWHWVRIHTDDGLIGTGEINRRPGPVMETIREWADTLLVGQDPRDIERLWDAMYDSVTPWGSSGAEMRAISAIDMALWDILGQSVGQPIWRLLGGKMRPRVPVYRTGGVQGESREAIAESVHKLQEQGYSAFKCCFFREEQGLVRHRAGLEAVARGVEKMQWVRDAVGNQIEMGIDCHPEWDLHGAVRVAQAVEHLNLMFFKCPVGPSNTRSMATVASRTKTPIMAGERLFSRWDLRDLLESQACPIINPDLAWCGGISETKRIATYAQVYDVAMAPHDSGPIATICRAHVMVTTPNAWYMELSSATLGNLKYLADPDVLRVEGSSVAVPDGPGLGVQLSPEILDQEK